MELLQEDKVKHPDLPIVKTHELWASYFDISIQEWFERWGAYHAGQVNLHQVFVQNPAIFQPKLDYNALVENPATGEKKSYYDWSVILKVKPKVVAARIAKMNAGKLSPEMAFTPYRTRISPNTLKKYRNRQPPAGLPSQHVRGKFYQHPRTLEWKFEDEWARLLELSIGAFRNRLYLARYGCTSYEDIFKERRAGAKEKFYPEFTSSANITENLKEQVKEKISQMNEGKPRIDHWTISLFLREAIAAMPYDFVIESNFFDDSVSTNIAVQLKMEFAKKIINIADENDTTMSGAIAAALRWGIENF